MKTLKDIQTPKNEIHREAFDAALAEIVADPKGTTDPASITSDQHGALRRVFEIIQNPVDWRGKIGECIHRDEFPIFAEAVNFFTGTDLRIVFESKLVDGLVVVEADGYRAGPCGDH